MIFAVLFFSALVATLGFAWGRLDSAQKIMRSVVGRPAELAADLYRATFYQGVLSIVIAVVIVAGSFALGWPAGIALAAAAVVGGNIGKR